MNKNPESEAASSGKQAKKKETQYFVQLLNPQGGDYLFKEAIKEGRLTEDPPTSTITYGKKEVHVYNVDETFAKYLAESESRKHFKHQYRIEYVIYEREGNDGPVTKKHASQPVRRSANYRLNKDLDGLFERTSNRMMHRGIDREGT